MIVNSASVALAMVLSMAGSSPFERGVVPGQASAAPLRLAAGKLWAPKKSKPKADDDDDTAKKEEELLKPQKAKPAAPQRSGPASRSAPRPAAATTTRGRHRIKMDDSASEDEDDDDSEGDDDEDDTPKITKRRKRVVEEDEEDEDEEDLTLPSLPVVRPRLAGLEVGPAIMVRSFHYDTPLQGDNHTRFGYQFAFESFPLLGLQLGAFRRIGIGASYEVESGDAGIVNAGSGQTIAYPVNTGHWGIDLRYVITPGARLVLVPALGYGITSANVGQRPSPMYTPVPSMCNTDAAYPCFANANASYFSIDLHIRVAATPQLSFSLVGGYMVGLGVQGGVGQISTTEATAKMQGFHVDVGASMLVFREWLAVNAQIPIRQNSYSLSPTMTTATYHAASDTYYGLLLGLSALAP
jgi:hypothetical protein